MTTIEVTAERVRTAATRLEGKIHRTPVLTSRTLDEQVGATVLVKCENFQRVGAFKIRGAYNAIAALPHDQRERGVCAYSSGNHAQAVALAARMLGTSATILMPSDAPGSKVAAVHDYGATIRYFDRYRDDRAGLAGQLAAEHGWVVIPPYDHPDIIAGQGTAALELHEDAGPLDAIVVPMGGGGLMAGTAVAAGALCPSAALIGVEPESADDQKRSWEAGRRVEIPVPRTVADGLAIATPGKLTFEINRHRVTEIVTVTDEEILDAMRWLFDRMKVVAEPSGAAAIAALRSKRLPMPGRRIGVILSGGNISADRFASLLGPAA